MRTPFCLEPGTSLDSDCQLGQAWFSIIHSELHIGSRGLHGASPWGQHGLPKVILHQVLLVCQIGEKTSISLGILTGLSQPEGMLISMLPRLLAASSMSILLLRRHASLQPAAWESAKASRSTYKARRCCTRLPAHAVARARRALQVPTALRALHLLRPVAAAKGVRSRAGRVSGRPCISPAFMGGVTRF